MKDFFHNNGILILIVAVLLALITAVVSLLMGGIAPPAANLIGLIATPVRDGINSAANWIEGIYSDAFEREQRDSELERLKLEQAKTEAMLREAEAAIEENKQLRSLLGLREKWKDYDLELATVTARSSSNWTSTLTISKGSSQGVQPNSCVIDQYWNLVGIVSETGLNWSTVTTIVDTDIELGGLIVRTGGAAILEGDFSLMGEGRLKLSYLPENSELILNDMILTSGKGGVYPPNLPVGHIEEVRTDPSGMTQYAVIAPETDLDSLNQVFVIRSYNIVE